MKIIVAIKQVPVRDAAVRIAASGRWIEEEGAEFQINEPDAYALEAALLLKETHGAEVVVLCAGPERASQSLREALAKGADRAIHVVRDGLEELDTLAVARLLSSAVQPENADLILTGLQSDDLGLGQTGVVMAEILGLAHASIVMEIEKREDSIHVKRELEDGWFQWVELPLPALLTIQSGISRLRYATLMGIKKAKSKEVRRMEDASPVAAPAQSVTLARVHAPQKTKETRLLGGSPTEAANALAEILRTEVRVL